MKYQIVAFCFWIYLIFNKNFQSEILLKYICTYRYTVYNEMNTEHIYVTQPDDTHRCKNQHVQTLIAFAC